MEYKTLMGLCVEVHLATDELERKYSLMFLS